ncbi:MAG: hypothetical protein AAF731_07680 [Bacteroidota bacterium]
MNSTIQTATQLAEICYFMPKMPGIGTMYNGGLFPINIRDHNMLEAAYKRYLDWKVEKGPEPDETDFEVIRQYCIYHIHAPIWLENPHLEEMTDDGSSPILTAREKALKIKNWNDIHEYTFELLDIGLDPL